MPYANRKEGLKKKRAAGKLYYHRNRKKILARSAKYNKTRHRKRYMRRYRKTHLAHLNRINQAWVRKNRSGALISKRSEFSTDGSLCLYRCRWKLWDGRLCSGRSTTLGSVKKSLNVLLWVLIAVLLVATLWALQWAAKQQQVRSIQGGPSDSPITRNYGPLHVFKGKE